MVPQGEHGDCTCIRNVDVFSVALHENELRALALCNPHRTRPSYETKRSGKEHVTERKNFCPLAAERAHCGGVRRGRTMTPLHKIVLLSRCEFT